MKIRRSRRGSIAVSLSLCLAFPALLRADPLFRIGRVTAAPGQTGVSVPIEILVGKDEVVTSWSILVGFDPTVMTVGSIKQNPRRIIDQYFHNVGPGQVTNWGITGAYVTYLQCTAGCLEEAISEDDDGLVGNILLCVQADAPPGTYPITILPQAESPDGKPPLTTYARCYLNDVDKYSPCGYVEENGAITVEGDPVSAGTCPEFSGSLPLDPKKLEAEYKLPDRSAAPGESFSVPFVVRANAEVVGFTYSVDFDEQVLEAVKTVPLFEKFDGTKWYLRIFYMDNSNEIPGNSGIDEGVLTGAVLFEADYEGDGIRTGLPRDRDSEVFSFEFKVKPEAAPGTTEIRFVDGGHVPPSLPITNVATISGQAVYPNVSSGDITLVPSQVNARIHIISDVTLFVRGDANGDFAVNISDAQASLSYLFLGGALLPCYDGADANDDGAIDITDPVATLGYLFLGGNAIPAPFPEPGKDTTDDNLRCR
jgi:hypothetical protein